MRSRAFAPRRMPCRAAVVTLVLAACAVPVGGPHARGATLVVDCEPAQAIALAAVTGDEVVPVERRAPARRHVFALWPGAYVVAAATPAGERRWPAPLFDAVLPEDRTVHLAIAAAAVAAPDDDEFAFVPPGPAVVGDTLGIGQEDERPARLVPVPAFWLARCECTNGEYAAFLDAMEPNVDPAWCAFDSRKFLIARDAATGRWRTERPDLPVVTVSLAGAEAYCAWRTRATGRRHRLPHEVEWEKAARGPESFVFAYGNVYRRAAANQESGALAAVGRHAANGFGLFDMTGNAFEWTADAYRPGVPAGVVDAAPRPQAQVLRGGSFVLDGMYLRNSFRMWQSPQVRTDDIGFRVLREEDMGERAPR